MKYMLLIYGNPASWDAMPPGSAEHAELMQTHEALIADLIESGEFVGTAPLTTLNARTVRVRGEAAAVTDGPFSEAKEVLAGYYLVACGGLERACEIAARLPEARFGLIEIRQVADDDATHV